MLDKYKTKQPGEPSSVNQFTEAKEWKLKQKIRYSRSIMDQIGIRGDLRDQVYYLIQEFRDTRKLCARCKSETVITALCFYVKFKYTKKYPLSDYAIASEEGLTEEIFTRITLKIAKHFQDLYSVRHVRRVI